jgi:hypothetical protein
VLGLLAACGNTPAPPAPSPTSGAPSSTSTPTSTTSAGAYTGDQQGVALCSALATLVAGLYSDAVTVAGQGRYGQVPPVVTGLLTGAAGQHTAAAEAWNQVLTTAGRPAVSGSPLRVEAQYRARLGTVAAPVDLLGLVVDLEATVSATITSVLGEITDPAAISVGAGVAPVAAMHGATASFLLGRLPVAPADPTAGAIGRDALTA